MRDFTVALFGHRELSDPQQVEKNLYPIIKKLLLKETYIVFLIGRNGEFDEYAASIIKSIQHEHEMSNSELLLILPYKVTDMKYYENYYDGILIPPCVEEVHPKSAIQKRNRWMVEQADLVIVNVEKMRGGAYTAMKYAKNLHTRIINLADSPKNSSW